MTIRDEIEDWPVAAVAAELIEAAENGELPFVLLQLDELDTRCPGPIARWERRAIVELMEYGSDPRMVLRVLRRAALGRLDGHFVLEHDRLPLDDLLRDLRPGTEAP